jgi:hypothetical protein
MCSISSVFFQSIFVIRGNEVRKRGRWRWASGTKYFFVAPKSLACRQSAGHEATSRQKNFKQLSLLISGGNREIIEFSAHTKRETP